jgi:hypothetical protein
MTNQSTVRFEGKKGKKTSPKVNQQNIEPVVFSDGCYGCVDLHPLGTHKTDSANTQVNEQNYTPVSKGTSHQLVEEIPKKKRVSFHDVLRLWCTNVMK